ncbi:RNA methyltransferase [Candidatus Falkowbacteria bacterium]|nr:RNA methyltransferase [Candidatus Falkowbacteria bacterium]MBT4433157.1 RNA methyltransferase [Candidatus Falkowbacteria bacterium]
MKELKITSKDNEKIKFLKKLNQKKYREEYSKFFIENLKIIKDAVKAGFIFEDLFVTEEFVEKNQKEFEVILSKSGVEKYYIINTIVNKSFSNLDTLSGICAVYKKIDKKINYNKPIVYLNNISDPGNLGTILRSALAFDIENIVLDENCVDLYNYKTLSAARGSIFKLNIEFDENLKVLKKIKKKMKVFSTNVRKGKDVDTLDKEKTFCIVLGSEARGVDKNIQEISDDFIKIKTSNKIESLNVATSAGIIFYKIFK